MIFRPLGSAFIDAGAVYFCDDLSLDEATAISTYFSASKEVARVPLHERAAYQHYASVQFATFYSEELQHAN